MGNTNSEQKVIIHDKEDPTYWNDNNPLSSRTKQPKQLEKKIKTILSQLQKPKNKEIEDIEDPTYYPNNFGKKRKSSEKRKKKRSSK